MRQILTATALALALATPAMAQSSTGSSNTAPSAGSSAASTPMQPGQMQEAVKHDLAQAGFTDIQVMPSSFLVRAKDKAGRPVMMVINPDSVTEITNMGKPASSGGSTGTGTTTKQ